MMKYHRLNPSQVARASQSLRVALAMIQHIPERARAENAAAIQHAYKFLDAPADSQDRAREVIAALLWSLDFIMQHTQGKAGSELADAFALLRELKFVRQPKVHSSRLDEPAPALDRNQQQ
jgi:hypothetical protein